MDLKSIMSGNYNGLENRIGVLETTNELFDGTLIEGKFFYLKFRDMEETLDEFVQVIYDQIVPFCISKKKRDEAFAKSLADKPPSERHIIALSDQAKKLFQLSNAQRKKSGEIGELILFIIQEYFLSAPQIACKMALKTSPGMPVHGADGIHIRWNDNKKKLYFLWGESKLYKCPYQAVKKTVESVKGFTVTNAETGQNQREREIEIIKDYSNINDPDLEKVLLKYFDPYEEESNHRAEAYSCFIGFNFSHLEHGLDKTEEGAHLLDFKIKYENEVKKIAEAFSKEIKGTNLNKSEFYFFLLPFSSVKELRNKFFQKLGFVPVDEPEEEETT